MCEEISKVCRLCMEAIDLNHSMEDSTTLRMVEESLQMTFVFLEPFLSAEICDDCYYKIKDFSEFKENCRSMQELLWQDIENIEAANNAIGGNERCEKRKTKGKSFEIVDGADEIAIQNTVDEDAPKPEEPPVILNSTLLAHQSRSAEASVADNITISKTECLKVSLYCDKNNEFITNRRAYHECNLCHKSYNNLNKIQRHLLTHKEKRIHQCEYCPMSFRQNSSLQVHIRSHTKEKPFVCPHCGNAYGYYTLLKRHLYRYHAPESETSSSTEGQQTVKLIIASSAEL